MCRTYNGFDINGLGQLKDGRGNLAPVTIILPTIAMLALEKIYCKDKNKYDTVDYAAIIEEAHKNTEVFDVFMKLLDKKIHEAKDMLIERFEWMCSQSPNSAKFMWENNSMAGYVPEEGIRSALKHGTLVIGQIAIAETLQILIGTDHTTERGMEFAKRIESLYKQRCAEFKKEYSLNFGVYYTPAENLCHTALKKFRTKYGVMKNISDRDYFTNSIHVPVWADVDPFQKIDIEAELTGYSNAGCITYVELPTSTRHNIDALESILDYAMDKDIPYQAFNFDLDQCENEECGYRGEINDVCPKCGSSDVSHLKRITGYLTGDYKTAFNKGKQNEVENRIKHIKH